MRKIDIKSKINNFFTGIALLYPDYEEIITFI